jgi:hypothetical protein
MTSPLRVTVESRWRKEAVAVMDRLGGHGVVVRILVTALLGQGQVRDLDARQMRLKIRLKDELERFHGFACVSGKRHPSREHAGLCVGSRQHV